MRDPKRALPVTELRRVVRCLRSGVPAGDVRVVRRYLAGGDLGRAVMYEDARCAVFIRPDLDRDAARETMIHEWAHVLAWRRHGTEIPEHGDEWALAYGDAYRGLEAEWVRRGWRQR